MKKLILLSIILIVGCEEPAIEGCTTSTDCNYTSNTFRWWLIWCLDLYAKVTGR